jgi:hypothetical protein
VSLPTLDEFLERKIKNSYIQYPGFSDLYLRSTDYYVIIENKTYKCTHLIQIANVVADNPGNGAFTRLVDDLIKRGFAVLVECVHNERFRDKLKRMGFIPVNTHCGFHFLKNHENHLI